jgi:hypothetical protein
LIATSPKAHVNEITLGRKLPGLLRHKTGGGLAYKILSSRVVLVVSREQHSQQLASTASHRLRSDFRGPLSMRKQSAIQSKMNSFANVGLSM